MRIRSALTCALVLCLTAIPVVASAKQCGNDASGFTAWLAAFRREAVASGISPAVVNAALGDAYYAKATIRLDRNQGSMKLSYEEFLKKRGAAAIIQKGRRLKAQNAALFASIEGKFGVPAGPLLAIWGMETAFGGFAGKQKLFPAIATLAYDCRRSVLFEEQLYAALKIVQSGQLTVEQMKGAGHGEIGQMQFLPVNYLKYGVDGDGDGRVDMISSRADALASTANYLRGYGWQPGFGYQPGEPNFEAIAGWNKSQVYQRAIAYVGREIDG